MFSLVPLPRFGSIALGFGFFIVVVAATIHGKMFVSNKYYMETVGEETIFRMARVGVATWPQRAPVANYRTIHFLPQLHLIFLLFKFTP